MFDSCLAEESRARSKLPADGVLPEDWKLPGLGGPGCADWWGTGSLQPDPLGSDMEFFQPGRGLKCCVRTQAALSKHPGGRRQSSYPRPAQPSPAQPSTHSVTHHTCKAHAPTLKLLKYRPPTGERALGPGVLLPVPRPHLLELPAASPAPPQPPQGRPHQSTANTRLNPLLPTTGVTYDRFYGLRKPRALSASR